MPAYLISAQDLKLTPQKRSAMASLPLNGTDWLGIVERGVSCLTVSSQMVSNISQAPTVIFNDKCASSCALHSTDTITENSIRDCIMYANISHYFDTTTLLSDGTTTVSLSASSLFKSTSHENRNNLTRGSTLLQCMPELCSKSSFCNVNACSAGALLPQYDTISLESFLQCNSSICPPSRSIDPDVAGIGVYISYFLQSALTILFMIILFIQKVVTCCRRPRPSTKDTGDNKSGLPQIVIDWAISFQKAQYFFAFTVAIAIASTVTARRDSEIDDIDAQALIMVTGFGIYSLTAYMCVLVGVMRHSVKRFDFCASVATWLMTLFVSQFIVRPNSQYEKYNEELGGACGALTVSTFCQRDIATADFDVRFYFATVPVMVIVAVAWAKAKYPECSLARSTLFLKVVQGVRQCCTRPALRLIALLRAQKQKAFDPLETRIKRLADNYPIVRVALKVLRRSLMFLTGAVCVVLVAGIGFLTLMFVLMTPLIWLVRTAAGPFRNAMKDDWTFGQVAAVVVWLPTLNEMLSGICKLLWNCCRQGRRRKGHRSDVEASSKRDASIDDDFTALPALHSASPNVTGPDDNDDYSIQNANTADQALLSRTWSSHSRISSTSKPDLKVPMVEVKAVGHSADADEDDPSLTQEACPRRQE